MGFPGGSAVKKTPANAEEMNSTPDLGRSHVPLRSKSCTPQQSSPCALEPVLHNRRNPHTAAREQPLLTTTREKPMCSNEDPAQPKIKNKIIWKKKQQTYKQGCLNHPLWGTELGVWRCCCLVTELCLTVRDPMDCSTPGSLSFTVSQSLLKLKSMESMMPPNHLILSCPVSCP